MASRFFLVFAALAACCHAQWTRCSADDDWCQTSTDLDVVSFGNPETSNFNYVVTSGRPNVKCDNRGFGDPAPGQYKECTRAPLSAIPTTGIWTDPYHDPSNWIYCKDFCAAGIEWSQDVSCIVKAKYGANGQWVYRDVSGPFSCNDETFGDIWESGELMCGVYVHPGTNRVVCDPTAPDISRLRQCGRENGDALCKFDDGDASRVKKVWFGSSESGQFNGYWRSTTNPKQSRCDVYNFGDPVYGKPKHCRYFSPPAAIGSVTGNWVKKASGPEISMTLSKGVSRSHSKSVTTEFGESMSIAISAGFEMGGEAVGGKITGSTTVTHETSSSVAKAVSDELTMDMSESCTVTCPPKGGKTMQLWQWQMGALESSPFATNGGGLTLDKSPVTLYSCHWLCRTSSRPPACPLGFCDYNDPECLKCKGMKGGTVIMNSN